MVAFPLFVCLFWCFFNIFDVLDHSYQGIGLVFLFVKRLGVLNSWAIWNNVGKWLHFAYLYASC